MKWILFLAICSVAGASPLSVTGSSSGILNGLSTSAGDVQISFVLRNASGVIIGNAAFPASQFVSLPINAWQHGDRLNSLSYKSVSVGTFSVLEVK